MDRLHCDLLGFAKTAHFGQVSRIMHAECARNNKNNSTVSHQHRNGNKGLFIVLDAVRNNTKSAF